MKFNFRLPFMASILGSGPLQMPPPVFSPLHMTGPGKRTVFSLHKSIRRSRYTGQDMRYLRALHGVGRPPHMNKPGSR